MNWINSRGGPLLLLPQNLMPYWKGIESPDDGREIEATFRWDKQAGASDYDRACDIQDYTGIIRIGSGEGLVLGEEPFATTWEPFPETIGGILVRWVYAPSAQIVKEFLLHLPQDLRWESKGQIYFSQGLLVLFDSAEPGDEIIGEKLEIKLVEGTFEIETYHYKPDDETSLILHKLIQVLF